MPTWQVGSQTIPVPAEGANAPLRDPTIVGLLDYFGFWIKTALDTRLAELQGPKTSAEITDACPVGHRFPWNHDGGFMLEHKVADDGTQAIPLPGIWMWCVSEVETDEGATLIYDSPTQREIKLHYVFPEIQKPLGINARSGILAVIGRTLRLAIREGRHASYAYDDASLGTPIATSLGLLGMRFVRGEQQMLGERPTSSTAGGNGRARSEGAALRFFPAYELTLNVVERVNSRDIVYPTDVMGDGLVTIAVNEEDGTPDLDILGRVLIAPDDLI